MPIPEMSLLTPSEFVRFQSFLSSIDQGEDSAVASEWSLYTASPTHSQPQLQGSESLAKATKDLISLEPASPSHDTFPGWPPSQPTPNSPHYAPHQARHLSFSQQSPPPLHPSHHQDRRYSDYEYRYSQQPLRPTPELFPFLKPSQPQDYSYLSPHTQQHHPTTDLLGRPLPLLDTSQPHLLHPGPRTSGGTGPTPPSSSTSASPPPSNSSRPSPPIPSSSSSKRNLDGIPSSSVQPPKRSRESVTGKKPTLLSPSQKKANHIQSEQKRRANIRRGYDALCETVPELRDAIREEEMSGMATADGPKPRQKRNKTAKPKGDDGMDKLDGRAGPRSENVVLSKSIDYIHELLAERETLVSRLARGRSLLPPDHPGQTPAQEPLWERHWTGGSGKADAVDGDEDEDDEDHS